MRSVVGVVALALSVAPAAAAEIKATSRVETVVVFPSGAEISRGARVHMDAGEHVLLLSDLPAQAVPASIRVEGRSSGRLEIGSVDTRRLAVPRADPAASASERRALEVEIEKLRDQRAGLSALVNAAETQKLLIARLVELPSHLPSGGAQGSAAYPDWNQLFAMIGERTNDAQKVILETQIKLRELDRRIDDLEKKLVALAPVQEERTELKVNVAAGAALDAELTIRYQVASASWTPNYDARLTTGARNAAPSLTLVRRASIQQRSGEDWADVALSLSTTRPGTGTAAPDLRPMYVDYEPDQPPPRPVASAQPATRSVRPQTDQLAAEESEARYKAAAGAAQQAMEAAADRNANIDAGAYQAIFGVPGKVTVPATGEMKRVQIDESKLEPILSVRTVPRVDPRAFLYAKLVLPKSTPFLAGSVSLFRDGTFVGNGRIPLLAPGEEHELGFGPDDSIRVRHAVIEEKRGEGGIITSSKTDQRDYRVTIKNLHPRAIGVTVIDQIPVPQNQDIKVELTGKVPPSKRDIDDKRGVSSWDVKLEPDEEKTLEYGWRVTWPSGKQIQYRR